MKAQRVPTTRDQRGSFEAAHITEWQILSKVTYLSSLCFVSFDQFFSTHFFIYTRNQDLYFQSIILGFINLWKIQTLISSIYQCWPPKWYVSGLSNDGADMLIILFKTLSMRFRRWWFSRIYSLKESKFPQSSSNQPKSYSNQLTNQSHTQTN